MRRALISVCVLIGSAIANPTDLDLAGTWDIAPMKDTSYAAAAIPAQPAAWRKTTLPNIRWCDDEIADKACLAGPGVWLRRHIDLDNSQAGLDAVIHWEILRWGFEAFVNGKAIGSVETYGPGTLSFKRGLLKPGSNELLFKVRNWSSLPRGGGLWWPLIPAGAAVFDWGSKAGGLFGDIGLQLFDAVRVRSVMMRPSPADSSVTAAVRIESTVPVNDSLGLMIVVTDAKGSEIGSAKQTVSGAKAASAPVLLNVKLKRFDLWSPQTPVLTRARVTLNRSGKNTFRDATFGMRSFASHNGHFFLNGKPFTVLGSNVLSEWIWNAQFYNNTNGALKNYLIGQAKQMSVNAVRTHTLPPLNRVANLCDTNGMMFLAEMPFTYNYRGLGFDSAEAKRYHSLGKQMSLAWIEELANHPSIIMWVSTNEPPPRCGEFDQTTWDLTDMIPSIKKLDPTRPVLRAGEESADIQDMHCYVGFWDGAAGDFDETVRWRAQSRDSLRPIGNSEYIEGFPPERMFRWLGTRQRSDATDKYYAMVGMKQTEALRRLKFDLVLPFMMHGWTTGAWRPYAPTPMFAALHNALAPITASLDISDADFVAGQKLRVPVCLINDLADSISAGLVCYVCEKNPDFFAEPSAFAAAKKFGAQTEWLAPRSRRTVQIEVALPAKPGPCWLAAVLTPRSGSSVMSQRELQILSPNTVPAIVARRTYRVVGARDSDLGWFADRGIKLRSDIPYGGVKPDADMLIVWENCRYDTKALHITDAINTFLKAGKPVLMMQQHGWRAGDWCSGYPALPEGPSIDYTAVPQRSGLAMREKAANDEAIWRGIDGGKLVGWNGLNNAVCRDALTTLPTSDNDLIPARHSSTGPVPLTAGTIVIEGETPQSTNFVVNFHDPLHTAQIGGKISAREFVHMRGGKASLLITKNPPADAYTAVYAFQASAAMNGALWVFEQGRPWASPFSWRIDGGPWQVAGIDIPMEYQENMASDGATFAWSRLGEARLAQGRHTLELRVTTPKQNGVFLLSQDCFMIAPVPPPSEILAKSGDGGAVLARARFGNGRLLITQLLLAERLSARSAAYDPAAERFMLNLMSY